MKLHPEEVALARAYDRELPFEGLTDEQMRLILDRGRRCSTGSRRTRGCTSPSAR